ncbi:hypothetical protein SH2C18_27710 [Clostridium sediminicola]|uniref:bifunctional diguanylate cyclase/phosphodiesterase n=1 Tax=Clostridium sediminicola TaxID=3114879 RepID=UPI0031F2126E
MRKVKNRIILRIVKPLLVILIILFVFFSIYFNIALRKNLKVNLYENLAKDTTIISQEVNKFFSKYIQIVNQMKADDELKDYIRYIKSDKDKYDYLYFDNVVDILQNIESSDNQLYYTWIGVNSINEFLTVSRYFYGGPDYNYSVRPWYIELLKNNGEIIVSSPYSEVTSKEHVVSVVAPIMKESEEDKDVKYNIGQVSIDIKIERIKEYISNYSLGEDGHAILITGDGKYVTFPKGWSEKDNILDEEGTLSELGQKMIAGEIGVGEYDYNGVAVYFAYAPVGINGWAVGAYIPKAEIDKQIYLFNIMSILLLVAAITIIAIFIIILRLKNDNKELSKVNDKLLMKDKELRVQYNEIQTYANKLKEKEEYIRDLAYLDPLTGLPNRRQFIENLYKSIEDRNSGAVIMLDLDNFKDINDTLGHIYGDKVLIKISEILSGYNDKNTFISRFGGDEFLILLNTQDSSTCVKLFVKKIVDIFNNKIIIDNDEIYISVSIGVSLFPQHCNSVNELIMNADTAMYHVKKSGKNNYIFFNENMKSKLMEKKKVEKILHQALREKSFELFYQPQVDVMTGEQVAAEALLRLKDSKISPAVFIPVAEETGRIIEIGRRVVEEVARQQSEWKEKGIKLRPIAINFSAEQINDHNFIPFLKDTLKKYDIEPQYIDIEITESVFMNNEYKTIEFLNELKSMGVSISLDDFGTGYSSISYLTFIPVDKIKLDKSLIDEFLANGEINVISNIIALAHSLDLVVVAEGVEDKGQSQLLLKSNCDYIQGYLYSKPVTAEEFENIYDIKLPKITNDNSN